MKHFDRRDFLAGLGLSMGLLPLLAPRSSHGQNAGKKPTRLIVMAVPNGDTDDYLPIGGETNWTARDLEFSPLAPLERHRERLLVLGGVAAQNGIDTAQQVKGTGIGGHAILPFLLTGARGVTGPSIPDGWSLSSGHASVDQYVAEHLPDYDAPFRSLVLRTLRAQGYGDQPLSYSGPCLDGTTHNAPSTRDDPVALFDDLFGSGMETSELDRIRAERKSLLDFTAGHLNRVQSVVGRDDKQRIQEHLDAVRSLEVQLSATRDGCVAPQRGDPTIDQVDPFDNVNLPLVLRAQMDAVVAAMACDLTRVATILASSSNNNTITFRFLADKDERFGSVFDGSETGGSGNNLYNHHTIAHNGSLLRLKNILDQWYFEQYAYLIDKLTTTLDPDGAPMIESTIVVYANMQSTGGGHQTDNLLWVVAGNANGYLKSGRFLPFASGQSGVQVPTNRVLATLINALGCPRVDHFAESDYGGELPLLLA